jgi:hypothetical protein
MTITINGTTGIAGVDGSASTPAVQGTDTNTGIFFPAADTIAFGEGGAEVARFDSSGNLGIGTTSPTSGSVLDVASGSTTYPRVRSTVGSAAAVFFQNSDTGTTTSDGMYVGITGAEEGVIWNNENTDLRIATNNTERARITSDGYFLAGSTSTISIAGVSSSHTLVSGTSGRWVAGVRSTASSLPWGIGVEFSAAAPNNTTQNFLYCYDNTPAVRMAIRSNGGIENYSANNANLSDRREKINFAPAKNYLDTICAIPVQTFNYIDQNMEEDAGLTLGVVAQDVQEVAPEFVSESNWGTQEEPKMRLSIYQTDLQYALMKCIQELKAELDTAKSRIAALEAK